MGSKRKPGKQQGKGSVVGPSRPRNAAASAGIVLPPPSTERDDGGWYEPYAEHAKTLRQWFVAFGVGAPVALIANDKMWTKVADSGRASMIVDLFLAGVIIQLCIAMLYKYANSAHYCSHLGLMPDDSPVYDFLARSSASFWLEVIVDIVTTVFLGTATWMAAHIVLAPATQQYSPAQ